MEESRDTVIPKYSGRWWIKEIETFEKDAKNDFWRDGETAIARYLDVRDDDPLAAESQRRYNIFWANTQILKSALYAVPPKPAVSRENADAKDDTARIASLMLERMLQQGMTRSRSDAHEAFKRAVEDRLLPGLGQVWLRYEPTVQEIDVDGVKVPQVTNEKVCTDYVNWRDFYWSPARRWDEVWWCARRVWMKRNRFIKRFGKDADVLWKDIREAATGDGEIQNITSKGFAKGRAEVFEIWCLDTRKVYFACRGLDDVIEREDDPLELEDFWPCPPPLLATHSNESLFPKSDYSMVQTQYEELDVLNSRISALTKALRVVGAYDRDNKELANMLTGPEMAMVAVENWAMLAENGGMARAVEWFPVEQVANVLKELIPQRQAVISQIYELTSISDIMRGASNPRETAKAQSLKAQYSSVRLQLTQGDVATFVQNALRLRAEIICRHFSPQRIVEESQILTTETDHSMVGAALQLLKNYEQAQYRIEVSEESLSMTDYTAEREMRIELITAVGQFLSQAAQMVQSQPGALPYMLRIVQWVVAGFRGSKDIETVLDQAIEASKSAPPQQEPQKPDHSIEVAQIKAQTDMQVAQLKAVTDKEIEQMKLSAQVTTSAQDAQAKAAQEESAAIQQLSNALGSIKLPEPVDTTPLMQGLQQLGERLQALEGSNQQIQQLLVNLVGAVSKKRRRIPRRDENGDIVSVDEEIIED